MSAGPLGHGPPLPGGAFVVVLFVVCVDSVLLHLSLRGLSL